MNTNIDKIKELIHTAEQGVTEAKALLTFTAADFQATVNKLNKNLCMTTS